MKKPYKRLKRLLKILFTIALVLVIIIVVPSIPTTINSSLMLSSHTDSSPTLIAHRGLSSLYPENTLPAFYGAGKYGFPACEFDIYSTKDGHWVVTHDENLENDTNGQGKVMDKTLEELMELTVDTGNGIENYPELKMPTLQQSLEAFMEYDVTPIIEIKGCDTKYLPSLKEILDSYELSDKAVIIAFDKTHLELYRELDPDIEMLLLSHVPTKQDILWCSENNVGIDFNYICLYKSIGAVSYAKKLGVPIGAWTLDNNFFADIMVLLGAEYITTNKILP